MSFMSQQNQLHHPNFKDMALNLLKGVTSSSTKLVLRQINPPSSDSSTEMLNEIGTTDQAIGDVTAEIMITTIGKIPSEMYYLEDTASNIGTSISQTSVSRSVNDVIHTTIKSNITVTGYTARSVVFLILTIACLILLFLCCITACMISKTRKKSYFFSRNDIDCDPECNGLNRPLLRTEKVSDTTSKTSSSYLKK
ncbi:hypothetical protein HZH66_006092 [Vespula vulgaris]|uniref:Uncharacterized protein n=2 Tax=Vespula vulgaris TaxID=7454 RepID=A0A834NB32_VESVU|nr:hypothetical protein HZH66_006092 [Vespula vulgaris]